MAIGNFLGGASDAFNKTRRTRAIERANDIREDRLTSDAKLRDRAIGVQEQRAQQSQIQQITKRIESVIGEHSKTISNTIDAGIQAGHSRERIAAAVEPLMADVEKNAASIGLDPSMFRNRFNAAMGLPTSAETAAAAGSNRATEQFAQAETLQAGGIDRATALGAAGVLDPDDLLAQSFIRSTGASLGATGTPSADIPPLPTSLQGKNVKWSPSKQRFFDVATGASFNRQGIPQ